MANKITLDIDSVDVTNPGGVEQTVTLVMRYSGEENLAEEIIEGEQLAIEIPSHAPPPQQKNK